MAKKRKNKKKSSYKFKRHKIKYPKQDPIKELMELYEQDTDFEDKTKMAKKLKPEKYSLKDIIKQTRAKRKRKIVFLIIIGLLILTGTSLAGFLYFESQKKFEEKTLQIEINAPEKAQMGKSFDYIINYKNLGEQTLLNSRLLIQYPEGFVLESSQPVKGNHQWQLGNLKPQEEGRISLTGYIIGNLEEKQTLRAEIVFEPNNFHSEFKKSAKFSLNLKEPSIDLITSIPANITPGQKFDIETKLKNNTDLNYKNLKVRYSFPEKFEIISTEPKKFDNDNSWIIPELNEHGESKTINIEGRFEQENKQEKEQEQKNFNLELLFPDNENVYHVAKTKKINLNIIEQAINNYLLINGSTENSSVNLGDKLNFSLNVNNSGEATYQDISIVLHLIGKPVDILDWENIEDENFGTIRKTEQGKKIIWDKEQISSLKEFEANEEERISFSLPLRTYQEIKDLPQDSINNIEIQSRAEVHLFSDKEQQKPIKSNQIKLNLKSNLDIGIKALYHYEDGTPIGSGPWPPEVGNKTTLQIFWDLNNDIHKIENAEISAKLPKYATWPGKSFKTIGEISFNEPKREITWKIKELSEKTKEAHANFSIEITPLAKHREQIIKILGNTSLSATDSQTGHSIIKTKNILTSALEKDEHINQAGWVK